MKNSSMTAGQKAAATRKMNEMSMSAGQKAALTRKRRAAGRKAVATRKANDQVGTRMILDIVADRKTAMLLRDINIELAAALGCKVN